MVATAGAQAFRTGEKSMKVRGRRQPYPHSPKLLIPKSHVFKTVHLLLPASIDFSLVKTVEMPAVSERNNTFDSIANSEIR